MRLVYKLCWGGVVIWSYFYSKANLALLRMHNPAVFYWILWTFYKVSSQWLVETQTSISSVLALRTNQLMFPSSSSPSIVEFHFVPVPFSNSSRLRRFTLEPFVLLYSLVSGTPPRKVSSALPLTQQNHCAAIQRIFPAEGGSRACLICSFLSGIMVPCYVLSNIWKQWSHIFCEISELLTLGRYYRLNVIPQNLYAETEFLRFRY